MSEEINFPKSRAEQIRWALHYNGINAPEPPQEIREFFDKVFDKEAFQRACLKVAELDRIGIYLYDHDGSQRFKDFSDEFRNTEQ